MSIMEEAEAVLDDIGVGRSDKSGGSRFWSRGLRHKNDDNVGRRVAINLFKRE